MDELHSYYARRLLGLAALLVLATFALDKVHTGLVEDHASSWALQLSNLLNHHIVLIGLLLAGELGIRKLLWRVEKPHLDFHGRWHGTTDYSKRWLEGQGSLPDPAPHEVHIKQDCLGVTIAPTAAAAFVQWRSLICDVVAEGRSQAIAYAYAVTYSNKEGFPARARGYEVLRVVEEGRRGRPRRIAGEFHQLVSEDTPVFSGKAEFTRMPKVGKAQRFKAWRQRRSTRRAEQS